jgi:hypothetical protein
MRDDFSQHIKNKLAERAGHRCSNPACRAATSGPQVTADKSTNVGVAAHISTAAPGGLRYNALISTGERQGIHNGIWLCQICAKLVDADLAKYTLECLMTWKAGADAEASVKIGKPTPGKFSLRKIEERVKRDLKMRNQMRADFLKKSNEYSSQPLKHPYDRFRYSEVIIHDLERTEDYLKIEDSPGVISPWFKHELFDFYNDGLLVILRVSRGIADERGGWAVLKHGEQFDESTFAETHILELGNIPFRNIRHYEFRGDNHYNMPHVYCAFADAGTPYEGYSFAMRWAVRMNICSSRRIRLHLRPRHRAPIPALPLDTNRGS